MSSSSSSSDDDSDGGMPAKRDVLGSDSESDDDGKLRVNESFAASFAKREKKRLDARGKALGADGSESDESSSESEDEDAVELTRGMDVKILETINAIRRKDPKIYDRDVEFFDAPAPRPQKAKQPKAQTYKDVARTQILAGGLDEDQAPENAPSLAYDAEQRDLRKGLLAELNGGDDGDLFRVREAATVAPTDAAAEADEAKLRAELAAFSATETDADAFLADFVRQRRWAEAPSDDECDVDDAADLDQLDATDAFEAKYNFRFEQAGSSEIATHARDVVGSMRRKDDARRKKREERKERKAGERRRKEAELRRLKNLKKVELEAQIAKVAAESGGGALTAATLEDDFDPEAYDAQMAAAFGDDYYGDAEALEKPTWSDDDDAEDAEDDGRFDDERIDEDERLVTSRSASRDAVFFFGRANARTNGTLKKERARSSRSRGAFATDVAAGATHTLALDASGRVWSFGAGHGLAPGDPADGYDETMYCPREGHSRRPPERARGIPRAVAVAAGARHSAVVVAERRKRNGEENDASENDASEKDASSSERVGASGAATRRLHVYTWGANDANQLGPGFGDRAPARPTPTRVATFRTSYVVRT